jgi:transposase
MESTGVYWKPVYYLLDERFELVLANAQQLKRVPGRKTDTQDCAWIAKLMQHGLIAASFVPPEPQRDLRELCRQRVQLARQKAAVSNRIQKVLEDANLKLGSVASDVLGKSGRAMLRALIAGQTDPGKLAALALGRLRKQLPRLRPALTGRVTEHHRIRAAAVARRGGDDRRADDAVGRPDRGGAGPFRRGGPEVDDDPGRRPADGAGGGGGDRPGHEPVPE